MHGPDINSWKWYRSVVVIVAECSLVQQNVLSVHVPGVLSNVTYKKEEIKCSWFIFSKFFPTLL